jgi:hypothetical protein
MIEAIIQEVAPNEPHAMHVEDAEASGIGLSCSAQLPAHARNKELAPLHVARAELNAQGFALKSIQLDVHQHPRSSSPLHTSHTQ